MYDSMPSFMLIVTLAVLAGFFAGTSIVLTRWLIESFTAVRKTDSERMLWVNKTQVRGGEIPIFSDEAIANGADTMPVKGEPKKPFTFVSPFRRGLAKTRETINVNHSKENGSHLPDDIKRKIEEVAAKEREQAA